jgi:hypothetical protein
MHGTTAKFFDTESTAFPRLFPYNPVLDHSLLPMRG